MRAYFADLFAYDADANHQLLDALRAAEANDRARRVFAHLVTAKQVWHARLVGEAWTGAIWPDLGWDVCADLVRQNRVDFATYLGSRSDAFDAPVVYQNSRGHRFETARRDILMHVLIHSGYHRGQLAQSLRACAHTPPNSDYITYLRQGSDF